MTVVTIDQWLNNPMETRKYALSLPFTTKGNYPGIRTRSFADPDWIPIIEKYLPRGERVTWFDTHPFSYNGAFQMCVERDGSSWIHHDMTDWAAILFLGPPTSTPVDAGLTLYRHIPTGFISSKQSQKKPSDAEYRDMTLWEPSVTVGNVFNRMVLFRGCQYHKSSMYFGDSVATGRLFQVFFFNTTSPPLQRWSLAHQHAVHMIIFSTNRFEYLEKMLDSMRRHVSFDGCRVYITLYDDYPQARDAERMKRLCESHGINTVVQHPENMGLGKTWREAWQDIIAHPEKGKWVFHVEEDVEFLKPVSISSLIESYVTSPHPITQVFLKRNVCYSEDIDFIAKMEAVSDSDAEASLPLQSDYFVAMCSIYPRDLVTRYDFSRGDPHEHTVRDFFKTWNMHSAMYGQRRDTPRLCIWGNGPEGAKCRKTMCRPNDSPEFMRLRGIIIT